MYNLKKNTYFFVTRRQLKRYYFLEIHFTPQEHIQELHAVEVWKFESDIS